jgi:hypothetical protein
MRFALYACVPRRHGQRSRSRLLELTMTSEAYGARALTFQPVLATVINIKVSQEYCSLCMCRCVNYLTSRKSEEREALAAGNRAR